MIRFLAIAFASTMLIIGQASTNTAGAHPWGGLVVDSTGAIYFTFVCPMTGDSHHACVWRLDVDGQPVPVLESAADPSDMILVRTANRAIFAAERVGPGPYSTRLWKLTGASEPVMMIPFSPSERFHASPYAVTPGGAVFFIEDGQVVRATTTEGMDAPSAFDSMVVDGNLASNIGNMFITSEDTMVVLYDDNLATISSDGEVRLRAADLKKDDPPGLPFRGANILFDMTVSADGDTYLAYYGNREVLKVDRMGSVSSILSSDGDWSPHGVDEFDGSIYVLESTTPPKAWEFWKDGTLRPRVRAVRPSGKVETLFEYRLD